MMKLKRQARVPWKGEIVVVNDVFNTADGPRYRLYRDHVYHVELDMKSLQEIQAEIEALPSFPVGDLVKHNGKAWYGITRRYWSTSRGCVLYDLLEFGAKEGHRMAELHGVPGEELAKVWP